VPAGGVRHGWALTSSRKRKVRPGWSPTRQGNLVRCPYSLSKCGSRNSKKRVGIPRAGGVRENERKNPFNPQELGQRATRERPRPRVGRQQADGGELEIRNVSSKENAKRQQKLGPWGHVFARKNHHIPGQPRDRHLSSLKRAHSG